MAIKTAYASKEKTEDLVAEIKSQTAGISPNMVIFFASSKFDPEEISFRMQAAFKNASVFGCSTAGELISGKLLKGSAVAMAFDSESIQDVAVEVHENANTENRIPDIFKSFESYYHCPAARLDFQKYAGIILTDGLSCAEEQLMERIGDLTDIFFVGASAGDDLKFKKTYVYAKGKAYTNAAVLALIKPLTAFDVIKTQSFKVSDKVLTATSVDESNRTVLEFNGKPAAPAYAEAIGVSAETAADYFMRHPLGLMLSDEPYVRSPQQIQGTDMVFYCRIKEGMALRILTADDIIRDTKAAIAEKQAALGTVSGIINFHCVLRTLELEQKGKTQAYADLFSDIPAIGFSTYGEAYIGHVNQTSTMLVFGQK